MGFRLTEVHAWQGEHVAHAIEMFFDDQGAAEVRRIWDILADHGLPSLATRTHGRHRPHVSLAVTESLIDADLGELRSLLTKSRPTLNLSSIGFFPGGEGVLFLGATVTIELLTLHRRVHAALTDPPIARRPYYLPGNWVPHCTLAQGLSSDERARAVELLDAFEPVVAAVSAVGVIDTTTGEITTLIP